MKILHVTDCYLPALGGIEMHVHDLAERQRANGHEVQVLTRTPDPSGTRHRAADVLEVSGGVLDLQGGAVVRHLVRDGAVDVVHAHLSVGSPLAWSALRSGRHGATVATMHSVLPNVPAVVRAGLLLTGVPWRGVTFTAVSRCAADRLRAAARDLHVTVLPNGIDPDRWRTPHVSAADSVFRVLSVGRFVRRKRMRAVVALLDRLRAELPRQIELRAVLVGDGPELSRVRRDVEDAGLSHSVRLVGARSRDDIGRLLSRTDAYVAPAYLESFGLAALEARCAGVPVVAMADSGTTEFVRHGVEGLLVDDDAAMGAALLGLATDPVLRRRIAEHNQQTAPVMSWSNVLARHEQIYGLASAYPHARRGYRVEVARRT